MTNIRQIKAREQKDKERILKHCPLVNECSGIYIFTREENNFKYAYIGQAKRILTRLAQHLSGYDQHIDLSIKKHGLYSADNQIGWRISFIYYPECLLDEREQDWIKEYADRGYQLRNKTSGGQGEGKFGISENKPSKTYRDGIAMGYEKARLDVRKWFKKHLEVVYKDCDVDNGDKSPKVNEKKTMEKFMEFIKGEEKL